MRRTRPTALPKPAPIIAVMQPADLLAAAYAADMSLREDPDATQAACDAVNGAFHRLVRSLADDTAVKIEPTGVALTMMAAACKAALQPVAFRLPADMTDDMPALEALGAQLAMSQDPLILALLEASNATHGAGQSETRLAVAFEMVTWLGQWASAAGNQFAAGAKAAEAARQAEMKQQSRIFGSFVINAYQAMTGNVIRVSRGAPGGPSENKPMGPLIRFCTTFYERLRARCAEQPETALLATQKALNPRAETIAEWSGRV